MQQLSSPSTYPVKWLVPTVYFGAVVLVFVYFLQRVSAHWASLAVLVAPAFFGIVGYRMMRKYNFRLMDEVWLDELEIVILNGGLEERIPINSLRHAEISSGGYGRHVTLFLKSPSAFGDEIKFLPATDLQPPVDVLLDEAYRRSRVDEF